jgi:ribosomal protein S18 acetylase RimI-like enzyme
MQSTLTFLPMAGAPTPKVLKAFRKDAGWNVAGDAALNGAFVPGSRVQWAAVFSGRRMIGIVRLELAPPQFCYLSELMILSGHRGRGVGAWFMEQIERFCHARRIARVVLQARDESRGFYEKLRFMADPLVAGFLKKDIAPLARKPVFPLAR